MAIIDAARRLGACMAEFVNVAAPVVRPSNRSDCAQLELGERLRTAIAAAARDLAEHGLDYYDGAILDAAAARCDTVLRT